MASQKRWSCAGTGLTFAAAVWMALCPGAVLPADVSTAQAPRAQAPGAEAPPDAIVKSLLTRDLIGAAGKEVLMITVEYLPGGASLPHRHNAQVFVYVLEGRVRMQVQGSAPVTLGPGETFYEGPDDVHSVSANASATKPARFLVFVVKDKGAPVTSPAAPGKSP